MSDNCKHYDEENGWCRQFSDWSYDMPYIAYCVQSPCPYYQPKKNKIEIETKYNTGDEVWFADYIYDTFYPSKYPGKIYEINIEITKTQQNIYYWVVVDYNGDQTFEKYAEQVCFNSYEECEQWCKEHN